MCQEHSRAPSTNPDYMPPRIDRIKLYALEGSERTVVGKKTTGHCLRRSQETNDAVAAGMRNRWSDTGERSLREAGKLWKLPRRGNRGKTNCMFFHRSHRAWKTRQKTTTPSFPQFAQLRRLGLCIGEKETYVSSTVPRCQRIVRNLCWRLKVKTRGLAARHQERGRQGRGLFLTSPIHRTTTLLM